MEALYDYLNTQFIGVSQVYLPPKMKSTSPLSGIPGHTVTPSLDTNGGGFLPWYDSIACFSSRLLSWQYTFVWGWLRLRQQVSL